MVILRADENHWYRPVITTFDEQTGFVLAHVDKIDYGYRERSIRYQGMIFQPKPELHITIISKDAGILLKHLKRHPDHADDLQDLIVSTNWSFRRLDKIYFIQEKPGVEAIVQMVEIPVLQGFLKDLSRLVGHGLVIPPTHITLYWRGMEKGIAIPDNQSFQKLVKAQIQLGEVRAA